MATTVCYHVADEFGRQSFYLFLGSDQVQLRETRVSKDRTDDVALFDVNFLVGEENVGGNRCDRLKQKW